MANPLRPRLPLTLVDGFAGGGLYRDDEGNAVLGSPLLLLQTVADVQAALNVDRHTTTRCIDASYHFVELVPKTFSHLNQMLVDHGHRDALGKNIHLYRASFGDAASAIIRAAAERGDRALFLLDQYNYSDVDLRLVNRILTSLKGSEVLLTFNVDSLTSFLSDTSQARTGAAKIGLEPYVDWAGIRLMKAAGRYREVIQRQLAEGIYRASGARFMTLFFVTPEGASPWSYWLVHLSNTYKANDVMKQVHWMHGNSFGHSLEPGVFQLGYQASRDYLVTRQNSLEFDTPAAFDQLLHVRSVDSLREHLCTRLYEMEQGIVFNDMVSKLANNTNATADMIKEALHAPSMKGKSWPSHKAEATAGRGFPLLPTTVLCSSRRDFASHSLCMSHWPTIREVNVNTAMQGRKMGKDSRIEWTHHTFNPWWGCVKVSAACDNCYADAWAKRLGEHVWGPHSERRFFSDAHWKEPLRWNREAEAEGVRRRVFCASMADVFENRDDLIEARQRLFDLIDDTPHLDWLLLTKRIHLVKKLLPKDYILPKNVWLGTTVENQKVANKHIKYLLEFDTPSVRFLSCEPCLDLLI